MQARGISSGAMKLVIREIHAAGKGGALNEEWFILENASDKAFSTAGVTVAVGKGKARLRSVGTLDPGFTMQPGDRVRVISGNPGKKAHGPVPEADGGLRNYHLFLGAPLLSGTGSVLGLSLHQHEVARGTFDPSAPSGVRAAEEEPA